MKQDLITQFDYSTLNIFRAIDQFGMGCINVDNLRCWLQTFDVAAPLNDEDLANWIRRFDCSGNKKLKFGDFCVALTTMCNYDRHSISKKSERNPSVDNSQVHFGMNEVP